MCVPAPAAAHMSSSDQTMMFDALASTSRVCGRFHASLAPAARRHHHTNIHTQTLLPRVPVEPAEPLHDALPRCRRPAIVEDLRPEETQAQHQQESRSDERRRSRGSNRGRWLIVCDGQPSASASAGGPDTAFSRICTVKTDITDIVTTNIKQPKHILLI